MCIWGGEGDLVMVEKSAMFLLSDGHNAECINQSVNMLMRLCFQNIIPTAIN